MKKRIYLVLRKDRREMRMKLDSIHHIALIVSDYAASKDFYVCRLGFPVIRMICRLSSVSENKELLLYSETGSPAYDRGQRLLKQRREP